MNSNYNTPSTVTLNDLFRNLTAPRTSTPWRWAEKDEAWKGELDLPGFAKDEVIVSIDKERILHLTAKQPELAEDETRDFPRNERSYRLQLPREVDAEKLTAKLDDGVLRITLPKVTPDSQIARHIDLN